MFTDKSGDKLPFPPRHVSTYRPMVLEEFKVGKDQKITWGPAEEETPNPANYLKKHSKQPKLPTTVTVNPPKHSDVNERLMAYPPRREKLAQENLHKVTTQEKSAGLPKMNITLPKMTVAWSNVDSKETVFPTITTVVPRKPEPACVDTSKGHKYPLKNSGLVLQHTLKKDYGKAPKFVHQHKQKIIELAIEEERKIKEQEDLKAREYTDAIEVLKDLEHKLQSLFTRHAFLPLSFDLRRNQIRKEKIEEAMTKVEKDIDRVKRFIADFC